MGLLSGADMDSFACCGGQSRVLTVRAVLLCTDLGGWLTKLHTIATYNGLVEDKSLDLCEQARQLLL